MKSTVTFLLLFVIISFSIHAQFTPNNLAVAKITNGGNAIVDDGAATGTNALLRPVTVMQYAVTGSGQSGTAIVTLNSTGTDPKLTIDQRRLAHEGHINLSANGQYLTLVGYNSVAGVSSTTSPNGRLAEKRIARIGANGVVDLTTSIPTASAYNNQPVRGAVMNGNTITVNGGGTTGNGVRSVIFGGNAATAFLEKDCRTIGMYGGNIYSYTGSTIEATGQPTITGLITDNTQFVFFDVDNTVSWGTTGYDLLYVANRLSGINKYYYDVATSAWVSAGATVNSTVVITVGFQSLTGRIEDGKPTLYGTKVLITSGTSPVYVSSHLVKVVDNAARTANSNFGSSAVELAATGNTEVLKGVAFTPQNPSIAVTPSSLNGFTTNLGTPSATQSYSVNGANLESNISISAPTGFEINTAKTGTFQNTLTLTQTLGTVPSTTIYTRLTGTTAGTPSGNITHTSTGASSQNVAVSGTITGNPTISTSGTPLNSFSTTQGSPSSSQTYTVSGSNLTTDITLTAPTGFEISTDGIDFFNTRSLTQSGGNVASTTISVRLKGTTIGTPSGDISHTSTGATTQNVAVNGTVNAAPVITLSTNTLSGFSTTQGSPSSVQTYTVSGTNLTADILLTAPTGFEISTDGIDFFDTRPLTQSGGNVASTNISVRLKGTTADSSSGNITHTSIAATAQNLALSGTVIPPPAITITSTPLAAFTTTVGTPSVLQTYPVSGSNLTADIALTAPTGFEISTDGTNFFDARLLTQSGGNIASTTISVRLKGTSVGTPSGDISHTSTGATTQNVAISGTVNASVTPTITITGGTLTAFSTSQGTPSATQNYSVSGVDLSANIELTAPTGFEINTAATGTFQDNLTLTQSGGIVTNTAIFVRLKGTSVGTPSGDISHTSTGATSKNVAVSGTVVTPPSITITGTPLSTFSATVGTPSPTKTYSVSGANLTADIALTAPTGFEINTAATDTFQSSLTLTQTSGSISATDIYVRLTATSVGTPSGNITHASAGVTTQNVAVSGTVVPQPVITITGTPLSAFSTVVGTPSAPQTYSVSGSNLTVNIALTAPTGFEISTDGTNFAGTQTLNQTSGRVVATTISVRLTGTAIGTPSGNITHTSTGATTQNVAVSGTVIGTPTITTTGTLTAFSTAQGTASPTRTYSVSGVNLSANINVTAPTGFEISLSATTGFAGNLTLTQTGGSVSATTIHVRLTGASIGTPSGDITHVSTGATTRNVAVSGNVTAPLTTYAAGNLVVLRVGNGSTPLSSTATNVNLLQYSPSGDYTGLNYAFPTTGSTKFVLGGGTGGATTQEGQLTLSGDGRYLTAVGYNADLAATQTGTPSMTTSEKIIARIDFNASVDLSTKIPTTSGFSTNYVRNVTTENGSLFFVTGSATTRQINFGTSTSSVLVGGGNWRSIQRFGGRNYYINFETPGYLTDANVATSLPVSGASTSAFAGAGINAAQSMYFVDADPNVGFNGSVYDLLYIPDITNGIRKWFFDGNGWVYGGVINPVATNGVGGGFYAVTAKMVNGKPELHGIKGAVSNNNLMRIIDNSGRTGDWSTGGANAPTTTTLAAAGANYVFRGLAFAPADLPVITVTPNTLNTFSTYQGTASTTQTYTVSGSNLVNNLLITAPTGYAVSLSAGTGFGSSLSLTPNAGSVATTTIYVRLTGAAVGTQNGNIVNSTVSQTQNTITQNVAVTGVVNAVPNITVTGTPLTAFSTVVGTPSATQNYTISGANLIADISLTAPAGFEISTSANSGFFNNLTLTQSGGNVAATIIYVRLTGASVGTPNGNITNTSSIAPNQNIAVSGNVIVNDGILIIGTPISAFNTTQATPSPVKSYSVGGTNITNDIVITAPAEYEISTSSTTGFSNTLTLTQSGGNVPLTPIYVRLTGATVGTPTGNITHTSTGSTTQNVAVSGVVNIRPVITVSVNALTGFTTVEGTPSATQNFTVTGTNLIANIALTALTGFEISTSASSGFAGTLTLPNVSGSVSTTTIYARLTGATISTPSGNINFTTTGAIAQTIAINGVVNPKPLISISSTPLVAFTTREGSPSATQNYSISGSNLTTDIALTAPTGFEISTNASTGFNSSLTLSPISATVSATTIYVRLAGTTQGSPTGNIVHTTTDGLTQNVAVSGTVSSFREIILAGTPLVAFTTFVGTASATQNFSVSGINLTNDILVTAPNGYELSLASNGTFSSSVTLTQTGGNVASTSVFVRLTGASIGTPNGNIALTSTGTDPKNVAVSGTVNAIPVITTTGTLTAFNTSLGIVGATQSYTLSGTNLLSNITITAPTGFLICTLSNGKFGESLTLEPVNGSITSKIIYVRINEAVTGSPAGDITHGTTGAITQNVAVSGTVIANTVSKVYYVSPTGNNNNDGLSPATAFQTLSKFSFNSFLNPGDVVYVMNGTYGAVDLTVPLTGNAGNALLDLQKSGTAGNPIKIVNYPGHSPLLQTNGWNAIIVKSSYVEIDGLKIRGANNASFVIKS